MDESTKRTPLLTYTIEDLRVIAAELKLTDYEDLPYRELMRAILDRQHAILCARGLGEFL